MKSWRKLNVSTLGEMLILLILPQRMRSPMRKRSKEVSRCLSKKKFNSDVERSSKQIMSSFEYEDITDTDESSDDEDDEKLPEGVLNSPVHDVATVDPQVVPEFQRGILRRIFFVLGNSPPVELQLKTFFVLSQFMEPLCIRAMVDCSVSFVSQWIWAHLNPTSMSSGADACLAFQGAEVSGSIMKFETGSTFILAKRADSSSFVPFHSGKLASCLYTDCRKSAGSKKVLLKWKCHSVKANRAKQHNPLFGANIPEMLGRRYLLRKEQLERGDVWAWPKPAKQPVLKPAPKQPTVTEPIVPPLGIQQLRVDSGVSSRKDVGEKHSPPPGLPAKRIRKVVSYKDQLYSESDLSDSESEASIVKPSCGHYSSLSLLVSLTLFWKLSPRQSL